MYRRAILASAVALGLSAAARPAVFWNGDGHEQIADIAWTRLTPTAKKAVGEILQATDPQFRPNSISEADVRRAFGRASTFPDLIKGNRSTSYEAILPTMNALFWPDQKPPAVSTDSEASLCKTWHYYDTPLFVPEGVKAEARPSSLLKALPEAQVQLASLVAAQKDARLQYWWLAWIEHLVGDAHQPLHCAESFASGKGDAGGNGFKLGFQKFGRLVNLHSLWDGGITDAIRDDGDPDDSVAAVTKRWLATPALKPSEAEQKDLDVASWIKANAELARTVVYVGIQPRDKEIAPAYQEKEKALSRKQAVLAGYRLAAILNKIFGK